MKKAKLILTGIITGALTGFFGSGGGNITVPSLENMGLLPKNAHATSIAITLPLSFLGSLFYKSAGALELSEALKYLPFGIVGAFVGAKLLKKISQKTLKKLFGIIMIIAGIRLLMR